LCACYSLHIFPLTDFVKYHRPDPYLLGAKQCNVKPERCPLLLYNNYTANPTSPGLVLEDAPSGVRSGHAAGCKTLAVLTSHSRDQIEPSNPDFLVKDLTKYAFATVVSMRMG
jgi:glycerol-1-phosphatase